MKFSTAESSKRYIKQNFEILYPILSMTAHDKIKYN